MVGELKDGEAGTTLLDNRLRLEAVTGLYKQSKQMTITVVDFITAGNFIAHCYSQQTSR